MEPSDHAPGEETRAVRLSRRRGWRRRILITATVVAVLVGVGSVAYAFVWHPDASSAGTAAAPVVSSPETRRTTTTKRATTTTTTIPPVKQPSDTTMPTPGSGLGWGSRGGIVQLYEARMKALHFDPGPVDDVFDQDTQYAVISVQKYFGQPRSGVIDRAVQLVLSHFRYSPAKPKSEPNRVEIDLDRQVLTTFHNWQPILITTTSTGSGAHFCGGVDGCQYAVTPTGQYHFYSLYRGWDDGKLGKMWNPYYFNGGIAVHGLESVPAYPASHGCARIPMHIANYFYTLVNKGESVFVVGNAKQQGGGYVGPVRNTPTSPRTTPPSTVKPQGPPPTTPRTTPPTTTMPTPTTKPQTPPTTAP